MGSGFPRWTSQPVAVYSQYMLMSPLVRACRTASLPPIPIRSVTSAPAASSAWMAISPRILCSVKLFGADRETGGILRPTEIELLCDTPAAPATSGSRPTTTGGQRQGEEDRGYRRKDSPHARPHLLEAGAGLPTGSPAAHPPPLRRGFSDLLRKRLVQREADAEHHYGERNRGGNSRRLEGIQTTGYQQDRRERSYDDAPRQA